MRSLARLGGHVPSSLSMAWVLATDFGKIYMHGLAVATRHDQRNAIAFAGQIAPKSHAVAGRRSRGATGLGPAPNDLRILPNPGLDLPPKLCRVAWPGREPAITHSPKPQRPLVDRDFEIFPSTGKLGAMKGIFYAIFRKINVSFRFLLCVLAPHTDYE